MNIAERFEFKFVLEPAQRDAVFAALGSALQPEATGRDVYPIVSLYYDTPDRRCYWDAWRRVPSRRKVRVRVYGTGCGGIPVASFVEVKHKVDGLGVKRRVAVSIERALEIGAGTANAAAFSPADARVVREVARLVEVDRFQPVCVMRYVREAFTLTVPGAIEPLRLTFDRDVTGRGRDLIPRPDDREHDFRVLPEEQSVMEVKGMGAVPFPVARTLARCGLSPRGFSKYCASFRHLPPCPTPLSSATSTACLPV